ncbi:hypothetical protein [Nitrosomonas sp. Nm33]|uniref:hypothetical protein n=1 Tax=Nitrosomonas sp. Nm33 TaxID=133724 RepID=UPI000896E83F|nr:hypothetical protein [Nitrosomonas sp. Nm33]SDZ10751.1 hypothetical protein SAMN05421755_11153 [Nitrosomonas sp. Nm33]
MLIPSSLATFQLRILKVYVDAGFDLSSALDRSIKIIDAAVVLLNEDVNAALEQAEEMARNDAKKNPPKQLLM